MRSYDNAAYKRSVTLLLMAAYTFNSMDRTIVSIIASPLKADLALNDTQVGLLGGTAFAALYAFGGIPIARLAERVSRVNIITVALLVWSALTALCGTAAGFVQLLMMRAGVGLAEAGCSPPAHSLISDYHPRVELSGRRGGRTCGGMNLACRSTLALATRRGLLVTLAFFARGSLHYFLAAAGLARSAPQSEEGLPPIP